MRAQIPAIFLREFLVRLALVALLVRALVPFGWMPNPDGLASGSAIVLCTSTGTINALIGEDGKPEVPTPKTAHSDVCVFAGAVAHGLPVAAIALAHPYPEQIASVAVTTAPALLASQQHRVQNPRGPPLSV